MSDDENATIIQSVLDDYGIKRAGDAPPERVYPLVRGTNLAATYCQHRQTLVDQRARTVTCAVCKVDLDPIAVISSIADDPMWIVSARIERGRLAKQIADLKEEIAKLKAAKRRATT